MTTEFNVIDLDIASTLYSRGHKLVKVTPNSEKKFTFVFENAEACNSDIQAFYRKELPIDAKTLCDAFTTFKNLIFYHRRRGTISPQEPR